MIFFFSLSVILQTSSDALIYSSAVALPTSTRLTVHLLTTY